jgi:hypothetical protein
MIITDLDDEFRTQRLPFAAALRAPSAGTAGCIAGETGRLDETFELLGQGPAIEVVKRRGKADMVELAFIIVEAEQQRSDQA